MTWRGDRRPIAQYREVAVTADMQTSIRASRRRVARSRGALSGILLVILGLWAALVPFIGPYFNLAYTPRPNDAWHWTAARGWLEVLPGAAAFLGGLLLLFSASRAMTIFGGWLAALGGAWLIIGPSLADAINLNVGRPDPTLSTNRQALTSLLFFYATGAAILFFASLALGRLSVLSVRDVRAAERRAEAEEAERQAALEAAAAQEERRRAEADRSNEPSQARAGVPAGTAAGATGAAAGNDRVRVPQRDERDAEDAAGADNPRSANAGTDNRAVNPPPEYGTQYPANSGSGTGGQHQQAPGQYQQTPGQHEQTPGQQYQQTPAQYQQTPGEYPAAPPPPREG